MAADKRIPKYWQMMTPTISALKNLGGSASIEELVDEVIQIMELPDEVADIPHGDSSRSEVAYRAAWARTYLNKSGYIENSARGVWSLTPLGTQTEEVDTAAVRKDVRRMNRVNKKAAQEEGDPALEEEQDWQSELLGVVKRMDPIAFERLCQRILRESGFTEVEVTKRAGDGGIDGHGLIRIGGLISFPVLFQSKRYEGNIGPNTVRDFRGAMMGRADKGLIITTSGFTREAKKEATRDGAPPIDLIDGEQLVQKLKELGLGVQVTTRIVEEITIDPEYFLSV